MVAMINHPSSFIQLMQCLIVLFLLPLPSHSADPDLLQDFCVADLKSSISINGFACKPASKVTSSDFFFDGLSKEGSTDNIYGWNLTLGNVEAFPGLNNLGFSINRLDFAPGGLNPPHSHPRAAESVLVVKGKLLVGFVTTGNVYYSKVVTVGEMFVIPRGLVHFQLNVGKKKALAFTSFNSQLPGSVVVPTTLFASTPPIPDEVLTKTFNVDKSIISTIRSKLGS